MWNCNHNESWTESEFPSLFSIFIFYFYFLFLFQFNFILFSIFSSLFFFIYFSSSTVQTPSLHLFILSSSNWCESDPCKIETNWFTTCLFLHLCSGGCFEWVSGANYFGEIIEWIGFAVASWSFPAAAFALFSISNIGPRALHHHRWFFTRKLVFETEFRRIFV